MSTPSAAAQSHDRRGLKKSAARTPATWYKPPADVGLFAAVIRPAPLHDDALSQIQLRIVGWLKDPRRATKDEEGGYSVHRSPPYEAMAKDLRVSKSTVWRAFKGIRRPGAKEFDGTGLIAKQSVQVYAVYSRDGSKRRVATHYYLPPYGAVLKARRAIPGIVLTAAGHPLVIGRRCRFVTRELAEAWGIQLDAVPASRHAAAKSPAIAESAPVAAAAPVEMPAAPAKGPPTMEDLTPIRDVLFDFCHRGDESDCRLVFAAAQMGEPSPLIEDIALIARAGCADRKRLHPDKPITPKFVADMVHARVPDWRERTRKKARDDEKERRYARDNRINSLAEMVRLIDAGKVDAADRMLMTSMQASDIDDLIATADRGELMQARALAAQQLARRARKA
jgi:hypothetical protein